MEKCVLIVDDEIGALTLIGIMLERGGFRVAKARDVGSALAVLNQLTPDLIITDVMMPGMDGIEFIRMLRERSSTSEVPIIILSARGDAESVMRGMEAGASKHLPKPILHHDIAAIVQAMLDELALPVIEVSEVNSEDTDSPPNSRLGGRIFGDLANALSDENAAVRGKAVIELSKTRRVDNSILRETPAQDPFWRNVYHSLGSLSYDEAVSRWAEMATIAQALTEPPARQNPKLLELTDQKEPTAIRVIALRALGHNKFAEALPILIEATRESDSKVRLAAVEAIGYLGDPQGTEAVQALVNDSSIVVRFAAINVLAILATPEAIDSLRKAIESEDCTVRIDVIKALTRPESQVEPGVATDMLLAVLENEEDVDVLCTMAISLGLLNTKAAILALNQLKAHPDSHVQKGAEKALDSLEVDQE